MLIRNATTADLSAIVEMSRKFYATTSYAEYARFNDTSVRDLAQYLIDTGIMLIAEVEQRIVGMVGLIVAPFPFNSELKSACEIVWWVEEGSRSGGAGVALLKAVEPAAKAHGCVAVQMVRLVSSPPQVSALYEHHGYHYTESSHTKVIPSWQ